MRDDAIANIHSNDLTEELEVERESYVRHHNIAVKSKLQVDECVAESHRLFNLLNDKWKHNSGTLEDRITAMRVRLGRLSAQLNDLVTNVIEPLRLRR